MTELLDEDVVRVPSVAGPVKRWGYSGTIRHVFHTYEGHPRGAVLGDGTVLRFPYDASRRWAHLLKPRSFVQVEGGWHEFHGTVVIDVDHMGLAMAS